MSRDRGDTKDWSRDNSTGGCTLSPHPCPSFYRYRSIPDPQPLQAALLAHSRGTLQLCGANEYGPLSTIFPQLFFLKYLISALVWSQPHLAPYTTFDLLSRTFCLRPTAAPTPLAWPLPSRRLCTLVTFDLSSLPVSPCFGPLSRLDSTATVGFSKPWSSSTALPCTVNLILLQAHRACFLCLSRSPLQHLSSIGTTGLSPYFRDPGKQATPSPAFTSPTTFGNLGRKPIQFHTNFHLRISTLLIDRACFQCLPQSLVHYLGLLCASAVSLFLSLSGPGRKDSFPAGLPFPTAWGKFCRKSTKIDENFHIP
jgi:hypothetical protein